MSALRDCCELKVQGYRIFSVTDEGHFLPAECQATGRMPEILLPCIPVRRNGKRELFFLTEGMRALAEVIPEIGGDGRRKLLQEIANKTKVILDSNELREGELALDTEHVFFDQEGLVRLLYLPVSSETAKIPHATALRRMRDELLLAPVDPAAETFPQEDQSRESAGPEEEQAVENKAPEEPGSAQEAVTARKNERPVLYLTERGSGRMIRVAGHNLTLGRRSEDPEGRLDDTTAISRQHCGILYTNGVYSVVDLQSTNGTGVNGRRIQPLIHVQLMNGDILKVVNHEFLVTIRLEEMGS